MNASNLNKQYVGRVSTRHVDVGLKPDLRLKNLPSIFIATFLITCIPAANAGSLGRLFFTPEQRAQLDYTHARDAAAEGDSSAILTVNGIVQKSGGARTVWVNGVAQSVENGDRNTTAQAVSVPGKSRPVKLKVGDKILLDQPTQTDRTTSGE